MRSYKEALVVLFLWGCATPTPEVPPTSVQAVATSQSAPTQGAAATSQATPSKKFCATIEAVLSAEVYRGSPPKSQSQIDTEKAYTGYREDDDHFLKYVACTYQVRIAGKRYSYQEYFNDIAQQDKLSKATCEAERAKLEEHIEAFTERCTNLRRGEYYGSFFVVMP